MTIFMAFEGIEGEHMVGESTGLIQLDSFQWGMSRNVSNIASAGRARSAPSISEVSCSKMTDGSSISMLEAALVGKFTNTVTIKFFRPGNDEPLPYLVYTLENTGISSFSQTSGGDRPSDNFTLNFTSVDICHTAYGDDLTGIPRTVFYSVPDAG